MRTITSAEGHKYSRQGKKRETVIKTPFLEDVLTWWNFGILLTGCNTPVSFYGAVVTFQTQQELLVMPQFNNVDSDIVFSRKADSRRPRVYFAGC